MITPSTLWPLVYDLTTKAHKTISDLEGISGIYLISHPGSQCRYIGASKNIGQRIKSHAWAIRKNPGAVHTVLYRHADHYDAVLPEYRFYVLEHVQQWWRDRITVLSPLELRERHWANVCKQNLGVKGNGAGQSKPFYVGASQ